MSSNTVDESWARQLRRFSPSPSRDPDAGLRALTHYERRLPRWRYNLRQLLIPIVRWETPYLARFQKICRSAFLDSYFAFTANLGTHTFFTIFLPICFWCGYPNLGMALVHMLCMGVYLSGALKDAVCLPRPLSPPLTRITMSGSAALEYGFPSTHTTNAVSAALFALYQIYLSKAEFSPRTYALLCLSCYCYAVSITVGRMYCGMHGFFDVAVGLLLGVFITWFWVIFGAAYNIWIISGGWTRPAIITLLMGLAVRFHPEPADNCPCFDDSVSFLGVVMGVALGTWHNAAREAARGMDTPTLAAMYNYSNKDPIKTAARLLGGVVMVFLWRAITKPLLLKTLPPTFRFVDHWGFRIPRRYFLQARDYERVPPLRADDNVIPAASEIPSMLSSLRTPRRRRVSVGPQSEADAREHLANREQRRKDDKTASELKRKASGMEITAEVPPSPVSESPESDRRARKTTLSPPASQVTPPDRNLLTPPASDSGAASESAKEDDKSVQEMFNALQKPRTRYDVEIITKLVVYTGIAWVTTEVNPILYEWLGLV